MDQSEMVTVVMPMYNDEKFVKKAIESVLQQTYSNLELIIVDDCSKDSSVEIVRSFSDKRIRFFENAANSGAAFSRNVALRNAKGVWIAFLDADDLWVKDKLEKQISFMHRNGFLFTYAEYQEIDTNGQSLHKHISGPKNINLKIMHHLSYPGCLTVMYKASLLPYPLQVDPALKKRNDDAMWLQVVRYSNCHLLPDTLGFYRVRGDSISHVSKLKLLIFHYRLYRITEKRTILGAWLCAFRNAFFYILKKKKYVSNSK
jgi:glycosyltransferase involved in cell wall biosynthesis